MVRNRRSLGKAFTPNKLAKKKAHAAEPANEKPASMKVVVRVRPPNERELEGKVRKVVEVVSDEGLVFDPQEPEDLFFYHGSTQRNRDVTRRKNKNSEFVFDRVFGENASNNDVYEYSTREILKALFDGYNCSVFAYGATGSGKTFTMLGNKENPGIAYQTMVELYRRVHDLSEEFEFDIRVSYLEVYNENVRDLLQPASKHLHLREDASNGVTVPGLTVSRITCADELFARLSQGNVNRSQHPTDSNAESSRSHAVFQTYIHSRVKTTKQQKLVKLSMIDLAGSEKASATGGRGARFCEGQNINRSLLALGNCINSLAAGSKFVPYRDSKLTRLLKDSLGGNCKTVMIANISPCSNAYEDTHRTLKYAERAKMIKLKIAKNVVASGFSRLQYDKLVETIQSENAALKAELAALKEELSALRLKLKSLEDERQQQSGAGPPGDADTGEVRVPPAETATVGSPPGPSGDLEVIQERKKELYQKLCADERALKRLQWKCYRRLVTTRRLNSLGSDHKELERKESRMRTFVRAALQQARQLRDSLGRHGRELEALRELEAAGDPLPARAQLEMKVHNSELQMDHMKELLKIAFVQNERDDAVIRMLCGTLKSFYLLLKAYGKVTDTMNQEYKECLKMIEGDKAVTFSAVKDGCRDKGRDELAGVASLTWESGQLASCGEGPAPGPSFDRWLGQVTGLLEEVELNSARRESIALGCTPVKLNATFCKEAEPEPEPLPEDAPGVVFEDTFVLAVAPSEDPGSARPDEQLPLRLRSSIPVNTLGFRTAASIGLVPVELGEQNKENSEALFKKPAKKQLKFASPRPLLAPRNAAPAPTGIRLPLKIRGQASSLGNRVKDSADMGHQKYSVKYSPALEKQSEKSLGVAKISPALKKQNKKSPSDKYLQRIFFQYKQGKLSNIPEIDFFGAPFTFEKWMHLECAQGPKYQQSEQTVDELPDHPHGRKKKFLIGNTKRIGCQAVMSVRCVRVYPEFPAEDTERKKRAMVKKLREVIQKESPVNTYLRYYIKVCCAESHSHSMTSSHLSQQINKDLAIEIKRLVNEGITSCAPTYLRNTYLPYPKHCLNFPCQLTLHHLYAPKGE